VPSFCALFALHFEQDGSTEAGTAMEGRGAIGEQLERGTFSFHDRLTCSICGYSRLLSLPTDIVQTKSNQTYTLRNRKYTGCQV
jgi:hypothetical protein